MSYLTHEIVYAAYKLGGPSAVEELLATLELSDSMRVAFWLGINLEKAKDDLARVVLSWAESPDDG